MGKGRLEAFSDGVIAIIITIMVLELKVPHGHELEDLKPLLPVFASYVLSFVFVGIYWNNHHHMLHAADRVNGKVLWANMHLLFWMSLIPFSTAWMGEHGGHWPTAFYGVNMFGAGSAYAILQNTITFKDEKLRATLRSSKKELISTVSYLAAIGLAFVHPYISYALFALVAIIWLVPDPRIERALSQHEI